MWTVYDSTLATWLCHDDIATYGGVVFTVDYLEDHGEDYVIVTAVTDWDDEIQVIIPTMQFVDLVYWAD